MGDKWDKYKVGDDPKPVSKWAKYAVADPSKKKFNSEVSKTLLERLPNGGMAGGSGGLSTGSKIDGSEFAGFENVLSENKRASEQLRNSKSNLFNVGTAPGVVPTDWGSKEQDIAESMVYKKQSDDLKNSYLKHNRDKIIKPIEEMVSNDGYKKFVTDLGVFNDKEAIKYFDDYVKTRGGGSYSRDMMVAALKNAVEYEQDKPKYNEFVNEQYKKQGIDVNKYGKDLLDKLVKPKVSMLENMKVETKQKADDYLKELTPVAQQIGDEYKQNVAALNEAFKNNELNEVQANLELKKINEGYKQQIGQLDNTYKQNIKQLNKKIADKWSRISNEIDTVGNSITDEQVWASIPDEDKKKIMTAQSAAKAQLAKQKNDFKKALDLGATTIGGAGGLLTKSIMSGWNQAMADFGDYLSYKGFDNSFTKSLQGKRTKAEELAPAKYEWNENPFARAITSTGTSLGASLPTTGLAIGVTAASGGLGLPAVITTLAGGTTAFAMEKAQNTGGVYRSLLQSTEDPSKAIEGASEFSEKQGKLLPLYFVGAIGLQNLLKGGVKKTLTGTGLELAEELPTEYYQGFSEAQTTQGYGGTFGQYIKQNPDIALDVAVGTLGQSAAIRGSVNVAQRLLSKAPNPKVQFYADMVQKGGVDVAAKNLQQQLDNDVITPDEFEAEKAKLVEVVTSLDKVAELGLKGDDAKAFITYNDKIKELSEKIATEQDEAVKIGYEQKITELKQEAASIAKGEGAYAIITMPGGGNQTLVMPVSEVDEQVIKDAEKIEVKGDAKLTKKFADQKSQLGNTKGTSDGFYQNEHSEKPVVTPEGIASPIEPTNLTDESTTLSPSSSNTPKEEVANESKKAGIEKRRKEELSGVRKEYKDALNNLINSGENTVSSNNPNPVLAFIPGTAENAKEWLTNKINAGKPEIDKINAKYDAELAELEKQNPNTKEQAPQKPSSNTPKEEVSTKEQVGSGGQGVVAKEVKLPLTIREGRRRAVNEFGIDYLDVKKGEASNVIPNENYEISEESEIPYKHTFESGFIGTTKVDQSKPFVVGYLGDNNGRNRYEFATASNSIEDIISVFKNRDQQEGVVEIYNPETKEVNAFTIYPEQNQYSNESVGLQQKQTTPSNLPKGEEQKTEINEIVDQEGTESPQPIPSKESSQPKDEPNQTGEPPKEPPTGEKEDVVGEGDDVGGITQAANAVRRADRGLPEFQRDPQSFEQWNNEAEKLLKEGYDVEKLMTKLEKGHDATPVENAIRKIYYATIDAEVAKNPTDELLELQKRIAIIGDAVNRRAGQNLVSLKGESSPLSSLSDFYVSAMEAKNTDKLTDAEKAEVKKDYEEVKAARDKAEKVAQDANAKFEEMKAENELLKQQLAAKNKTKSDKVYSSDGKRDFKAEIKNYKDELVKAKEEHIKWMKDNGIQSASIGGGKFVLTNKMAKIILKIAATHVEQVGVKIAEVTKRTWEDVKDIFDDITENDIRDVFSGKYNEKKPTRAEIIAQMRELGTESKLLIEYENLLKNGEPKEETRKQKRNQRLTDIRKQIDELNKERGTGKYSDEAIAKRAIDANNRKRAEFQRKLRDGDFEKEKKPVSIYDSPEFKKKNPKLYNELLDSQNQAHDSQLKFEKKLVEEEMKKWGLGEKARSWMRKAAGTVKTLFASFDASAIAVQNLPFLFTNYNLLGLKGIVRSYKGFLKQKAFDRYLAEVHNSPDWPMVKECIRITEPKSLLESGREEFFPDRFKAVVTINGKQYGWIKIGGGKYELIDISKPFERQFTMMGNILRLTKFRTEAAKLYEKGFTWEKNREEFETLGRRINNLTSSAEVPAAYQNELTRTFIWSTRLLAAKLNMLGISDIASAIPGLGVKKGYYRSLGVKGQKLSRQQWAATQDLAKFAVSVVAASYLYALAMGWEINDDPDDDKFMDVTSPDGTKSMNFTGGFSRVISLIFQMARGGERKKGVFKKWGGFTDRVKQATSFVAGKAPPITRSALNLAAGKDMAGQEVDLSTEASKYVMPLAIGQIYKQIERDGVEALFTQGILMYIGINAKDSRDYPLKDPYNSLTPEEKKDPTFKSMIERGVKIPNIDPEKINIEKVNGKVTKKLTNYPDKQEEFIKEKKNYIKEEYGKLSRDEYYIYRDTGGRVSVSQTSSGDLTKSEIKFKDLTPEEIDYIFSSNLSKKITVKVKKEVLGIDAEEDDD